MITGSIKYMDQFDVGYHNMHTMGGLGVDITTFSSTCYNGSIIAIPKQSFSA